MGSAQCCEQQHDPTAEGLDQAPTVAAREELFGPVCVDGSDPTLCAQDEAPKKRILSLDMLTITIPDIPGDVGLCGDLTPDLAGIIAMRFNSWVWLNKEDADNFWREDIKAAGCEVALARFPGPPSFPCPKQVEVLMDALDRLPRPVMLQCNTGLRAGVALLLWLAKRRHYTAESAAQLGNDVSLKFFTSCMRCGPMRDWMLQQLPDVSTAMQQQSGNLMFRQLFDELTCTFTYLLGDAESKEALLIDPVLEKKDRDLALLAELGLKLKYALNTHCHAEHITAGGAIRKELPHVKTVIAKAARAKADLYLVDGDRLPFGKFALETISTPGHTPGCCTFLLRSSPAMLFTGDALLIRGCGRTDFQQGDAGQLYDSVHQRIFSQPEETVVYPGHDYKGRNVSSVGEEKRFNPRLTMSRKDFAKYMAELRLPYPHRMDEALPANMICGI